MSSTYQAICLNHDPALTIEGDWSNPTAAIAAAVDRARDLGNHAECDILIGRYSAPLIEVACPPHSAHPHEALWVDAAWLRLAAIVGSLPEPSQAVTAALARIPRCWTPIRVQRLRRHLHL